MSAREQRIRDMGPGWRRALNRYKRRQLRAKVAPPRMARVVERLGLAAAVLLVLVGGAAAAC